MKTEDLISQWGTKFVVLIILGVLYFLFIQSSFPIQIDILAMSGITFFVLLYDKIFGFLGGIGADVEEKESEIIPVDRMKRMVIEALANRRNNWLKDHLLTPVIYGFNRTGLMKIEGPFENGYVPINPSKHAKVHVKGPVMSYFECVDLIKNNDLEKTAQKFSPTKKKEAYSEYAPPRGDSGIFNTTGGT